ncbi:MAG: arylsulfatase A, partial [Planctomycetota bacterium]
EEYGLADNTLVVFTSDNGALDSVADNRPLRRAKGYLYEGGIRVPTIVRWPGRTQPGSVSAEPVISTDLFPSLLSAAGVALPEDYPGDGADLVPLWSGSADLHRDALYFHYPNYAWHRSNRLGGAIRRGDHKLIERFDDGSLELYDLSQDISEEHNLAQAQPELAQELQAKLAAWRRRVDAAMPTRANNTAR